jgi:CDP-diacylglycerol--glycerol-3-phosphate 3-phosphatidyltransferase
MWALARPLARFGVRPTMVTVGGVVSAVGALWLARPHPGWAGLLVVAAALCDGLDGAVAVMGRGGSAFGARADTVADRVVDVLFGLVIWRSGAPLAWGVAVGALAVLVDLVRRWRRLPARITVAERPTWTICALLSCVSAALSGVTWPAVVCAAVGLALGGAALGQLLAA